MFYYFVVSVGKQRTLLPQLVFFGVPFVELVMRILHLVESLEHLAYVEFVSRLRGIAELEQCHN